MRVDVVSENPIEAALSAAGVLPLPVVRLVWSTGFVRAFEAALSLGLFDAVEAFEPAGATHTQVAERLGCDPAGIRTLLMAMNGFALLSRRAGRYHLNRTSRKWLVRSSPDAQTDALAFGPLLDDMLKGLDAQIRTGSRENFHARLSPDGWRRYIRGLAALSKLVASEIARKIPVGKAPAQLLDVAGGHGMYSVAMARRHPTLSCTVLDLPQGAALGRELVEEAGFSDRVTFREGDLRDASWGTGHDVVQLFNILHNLEEDAARAAVRQAFQALKPGGTLAVLDGETHVPDGDLSFASGYGALLFHVLSASETWPESTMRGWMQDAGFRDIRRRRLLGMPDTLLLTGRKPV